MRAIIEEKTVEETIRCAKLKYPRLGEDHSGPLACLKWVLSRIPEKKGVRIDDRCWLYKQNGTEDVPEITALYTFDENIVTLLAIKFD